MSDAPFTPEQEARVRELIQEIEAERAAEFLEMMARHEAEVSEVRQALISGIARA